MIPLTVVILAGGLATRMVDICKDTPKSMLRFGGYPFLQYLVSWFVRSEVPQIIIVSGHLSEQIENLFCNDYWRQYSVRVIKEPEPLGTGGAFKFATKYCDHPNILLCNGDTILSLNLPIVFDRYSSCAVPITAVLTMKEGVPNQGAITVEGGLVVEFDEGGDLRDLYDKGPDFRASSTGYYLIRHEGISNEFPCGKFSLERELMPKLVKKKLVAGFNNRNEPFFDFGTPEIFNQLQGSRSLLDIYGLPIIERCRYE